ncbi:MAG: DNA recombination/repair protein RecA [Acidobacteriia bacterium]|nr:DNA recombination/repair protein RecA [Terriglobia bacterium]
MSSFPLFSPEAARRPVAAALKSPALVFERLSALPKRIEVTPASQLAVQPAPEMVSSGVGEIDALTGGLPRGCLTEVCGSASSGRTSLLLAVLSAATRRQETCALVDVSDALDPTSAAKAGVDFKRLLWVRCGPQTTRPPRRHGDTEKNKKHFDRDRAETAVEQALRVTDLLLQSGGFGLVLIDLGDVPLKTARRIPLTSWFRFQRAVEHTPTVLFVVTPAPCAQTCATLLLKVSAKKLSALSRQLSDKSLAHAQLLEGLHVEAELLRARLARKPMQSVTAFSTKATGAG